MRFPDPDFAPDPKKITRHRGALYNPWLNITVAALLTAACTVGALWAVGAHNAVKAGAPYPDQALDATGILIGAIALGIAAVGLAGATVFACVWWARRIRLEREACHE